MALQGLDRAVPPDPATAKKMLARIGGRWWNVYIGGPEATHAWTPADVADYVRHGIDRFMLTYVGRQSGGPLTRAQGEKDAADALRIARSFGYGGDFPLCLDVEIGTFNSAPAKTVEYARAWCAAARAAGARPGVYANPGPLQAMAEGKVGAEFVWVASWVSHLAGKHDPHAVSHFPDELWGKKGQRAWQYAGNLGKDRKCQVLGLDVDISVADAGCLAAPPGAHAAIATVAASAPAVLRRDDEGARVQRLTRRLSVARSRTTGKPYLDGRRRRFDAETERAVKAFQREHGLDDDGRYGHDTARKLRAVLERQREHRHLPADGKPAVATASGDEQSRGDVAALAARACGAARAERDAFAALVARGLQLRRKLAELEEKRSHTTEALLEEIVVILRRIEDGVEDLGDEAQAGRSPATATATAQAKTAVKAKVTELAPYPPPPPEGPHPPDGGHNGAAAGGGDVGRMSDGDLVRLVHAYDDTIDAARAELVERFTSYERRLGRLRPGHGDGGRKPVAKPAGEERPARGHGHAHAAGSRADIRLGDEGWVVRGSKIALARYLAAKGGQEHTALRRSLRREARRRKGGDVATQRWQKAVRAAQHIAMRPVTGVLDGDLQQLLRPHWPTDSAVRRLVRQTVAWRLIPGQVSPNFNLREFACKDGTPYVTGLVREQHLTKEQAKERARELAKRLERVRKADGNRPLQPTSVYRTIAHNATLPGAVPNSSHVRGFAADLPAPAGVPLTVHHTHVRAAFEAGCGLYFPAAGNFVHGDFDRGLGLNRNWTQG